MKDLELAPWESDTCDPDQPTDYGHGFANSPDTEDTDG